MSKGSWVRPRSVSNEEYAQRWDMIFGTDHKQPCGCGRSTTGYCDGSHSLSQEEYEERLFEQDTSSSK
jgi:CDGSH-type Zn-finger protein